MKQPAPKAKAAPKKAVKQAVAKPKPKKQKGPAGIKPPTKQPHEK